MSELLRKLPPHIAGQGTMAKRFWGQSLAMMPVFVTACVISGFEVLRFFSVCLVSALAFDFLMTKFLKKKETLSNGETVLAAALFSLLLPSGCPAEVIILGVFVARVLACELFGGIGASPFHPLLGARIFLQVSFPSIMGEPVFLTHGNLWTVAALAAGGALLLKQRQIYGETPFLFIMICYLCTVPFTGWGAPLSFYATVLFVAFFLLTDPASLPLSRKGVFLFVAGTALFSSGWGSGVSIRSASYAVLLMNLLTPWIDLGVRPRFYKKPLSGAVPL